METIEPLPHAETTVAVHIATARGEIVREIGMRRRIYPKWAHEGRNGLTVERACLQIAALESALQLLDATVAIAGSALALRDAVTVHVLPAMGSSDPTIGTLAHRVELLDAALAKVDRYKFAPKTGGDHA